MSDTSSINIFDFHNSFYDKNKDIIEYLLENKKQSLGKDIDNFDLYKRLKLKNIAFLINFSAWKYLTPNWNSSNMRSLYVYFTKKNLIKIIVETSDRRYINFAYSSKYSFISISGCENYTFYDDTISATRSFKFTPEKIIEATLGTDKPNMVLKNSILDALI